jgi:Transglycosylase SLT domain
MATTVPTQYQPYITQAAQATGLPESIVAAQANEESGFNPNAVSSAGAEGFWQFMPGTYSAYAAQAGVPSTSEFDVADETRVYGIYMNTLLQQEGGDVFQALEAYNAGPGNLSAGAGYANAIMANAGVSTSTNVTPAQTSGITVPNILNLLNPASAVESGIAGALTNSGNTILGDFGQNILHWLGVPDFKDLMQRLGLILLGAVLVIVGLVMITKQPVTEIAKAYVPEA